MGKWHLSIQAWQKNIPRGHGQLRFCKILQHRAVDMFINIEEAHSLLTLAAANAWGDSPYERARSVSAAKALFARATRFSAQLLAVRFVRGALLDVLATVTVRVLRHCVHHVHAKKAWVVDPGRVRSATRHTTMLHSASWNSNCNTGL